LDVPSFTLHRLTPGIESLPQNRPFRLDELPALINGFFKCLTGSPSEISQIGFGTTSIPSQPVTGLTACLRRQ
jgi:hypothetical protein